MIATHSSAYVDEAKNNVLELNALLFLKDLELIRYSRVCARNKSTKASDFANLEQNLHHHLDARFDRLSRETYEGSSYMK